MTWKVSLDKNGLVDGFFPENYCGNLPVSKTIISVLDDEYKRVLKIMPAIYVEGKGFEKYEYVPSLPELKAQKKAEIAAARYEVETAGTTVNGVLIDTGRDSQALITGAALAAMLDPEYSLNWKTVDGFNHLTAPEIIAVVQAVRAHVQACFDREAELCALVDAAETKEDLDEIIISWPV